MISGRAGVRERGNEKYTLLHAHDLMMGRTRIVANGVRYSIFEIGLREVVWDDVKSAALYIGVHCKSKPSTEAFWAEFLKYAAWLIGKFVHTYRQGWIYVYFLSQEGSWPEGGYYAGISARTNSITAQRVGNGERLFQPWRCRLPGYCQR